MKGVRPQVTGQVQIDRNTVSNVALWIQDASGNQPQLKGTIKEADKDGKSGKDAEVQGYLSLWLHGYKLVKV